MAAVTHAVETASTANVTTYASGAFTPAAGDLLVVFAEVSATAAAGSMSASANGITFTKVTNAASGGGAHMLYCFVANQLVPASPVSMTVTMDVTGDAGTGCVIEVARVSGMTNVGLAAIRQSAVDQNRTTGVPAPAFASACLTGNVTMGAVGEESGPLTNSAVPPTGTTERGDIGYATPSHSLEYWSRDSGFTGTTVTWTSVSSAICGAIVIELDTSGGAAPDAFAPQATQQASSGWDMPKRYPVSISRAISPMDNNAPDVPAYAMLAQSRPVPSYRGPRAFVVSAYDQPAVTPGTWASVAPSRPTRFYRGSYSAVMGAADEPQAVPGGTDWASVVQGYRPPRLYLGSPSRVILVPDQPVVGDTWAALTQSRPAPFYSTPRDQNVIAWGPSVITDAWVPPVLQQGRPGYRGPLSRTIAAYDQAAAVFGTEWTPSVLGRQAPGYRGPLSRIVAVYDQPAAVFGSEWTPAAVGKQVPYYPGAPSRVVGAADELVADPWAVVYVSRAVEPYDGGPSVTAPVYDQPAFVFGTEWVPSAVGRQAAGYRAPPGRVIAVYDQPAAVFGSEYAALVSSRKLSYYRGPLALTIPVFASAAAPDAWASVTQGRLVERYQGSPSIWAPALTEPIVPDVWAQAVQSLRQRPGVPKGSVAIPVFDVVALVPGIAFVTQSRALQWFGHRSTVIFALDGESGIIPDQPSAGGGGDFVVFRDPFRHNPFRDPFAKSPIRLKTPRGER